MEKNTLVWLFTTFTVINCNFILDSNSSRNEVADCIGDIIETVESVTDLTVVNFKDVDALFLRYKSILFISRTFLWLDNVIPNHFYVIECADYEELQSGVEQLRNDFFWNPRGKFIIYIKQIKEDIEYVSSFLLRYNIFNVTVVTPSDDDYEIYAFNPQLDACGKPAITTLELLTQCSKLKATDNLYRYETPKTLKGCHVKVISHNYWPFSSFNKTLGLGISQHRLKLWADSEGLILEVREHKKKEDFGELTENFTLTGMLHLIETGEVNAAVGGFSINYKRVRALDYSYPYSLDYTRVVVARAQYINNWKAVLRQFSLYSTIIMCFFIAFFCFAVVHFSIFKKKKRDVIRDILIVFGYICSNITVGTRAIRNHNSLRLIVCCMLIFVFFMSFMVQAYLLSATTNPLREHQIKHLEEALTKCKPLKSRIWLAAFNTQEEPDCPSMIDCLNELKLRRNEKLYTAVAEMNFRTVVGSFVNAKGQAEVVKTLEPLILLLRTMYFERGSSLFHSYARLTQISRHSGLSIKKFSDILLRIRLKNAVPKSEDASPEWLHQFREVFLVLLVGYSVSLFVFIYECKAYFRCDNVRRF